MILLIDNKDGITTSMGEAISPKTANCADDSTSINGKCQTCSNLYGYACDKCNSSECQLCQGRFTLIDGSCVSCESLGFMGCNHCDNGTLYRV